LLSSTIQNRGSPMKVSSVGLRLACVLILLSSQSLLGDDFEDRWPVGDAAVDNWPTGGDGQTPVTVSPWGPETISDLTDPQGDFARTRAARNGGIDSLRNAASEPSPVGSPFRNGDPYERVFPSPEGPIRVTGNILTEGKAAAITDISVIPVGASSYNEKLPVGSAAVRNAQNQMAQDFFDAGYDAFGMSGVRVTGARRGPKSSGVAPIYLEVMTPPAAPPAAAPVVAESPGRVPSPETPNGSEFKTVALGKAAGLGVVGGALAEAANQNGYGNTAAVVGVGTSVGMGALQSGAKGGIAGAAGYAGGAISGAVADKLGANDLQQSLSQAYGSMGTSAAVGAAYAGPVGAATMAAIDGAGQVGSNVGSIGTSALTAIGSGYNVGGLSGAATSAYEWASDTVGNYGFYMKKYFSH
jgi:hypothetical protein